MKSKLNSKSLLEEMAKQLLFNGNCYLQITKKPNNKGKNMTITNKEKSLAYEGFIVDMQISLNSAMEERGFTRKDLSNMTGYSDYEILDFFDEMNRHNTNYMEMMTTIAYAIGYEITLNLGEKINYG